MPRARDNADFFVDSQLLLMSWQILLAPAGGMEYPATDPYTDYYGPDGGPLDFSTPPDVSMY